jgi:DNA-binding transcriptional MerR regulator
MDYSLKEAAEFLDITPTTLRRWNERFDALLSESAYQAYALGGSQVPRLYTEADIAILQQAKTLIWRGYSYDQVLQELAGYQIDEHLADPVAEPSQSATVVHVPTPPLPAGRSMGERPKQLAARHDSLGAYPATWKERLTDRRFLQIVTVIVICVIVILVAAGIVRGNNPWG